MPPRAPPIDPAPRIAMKAIGVDYSTEMNTGAPTGDGELAGKVALVTGSSRGIGRAIAGALIEVWCTCRDHRAKRG